MNSRFEHPQFAYLFCDVPISVWQRLANRMGTRLRYHICSHVHSPYNSTAKGSRMSPPLAQVTTAAGPREKSIHAEAVVPLS